MFPGEVILILRMDHLSDYCSSGGWQTARSQKNFRGKPFCLRTSTCGRAHWPFLTQNSCVWLHLLLPSSRSWTIPVLCTFAFRAVTVVRCHLTLHWAMLPSHYLWLCVHFMYWSLCVCSQRSYISYCLFFHHMVNVMTTRLSASRRMHVRTSLSSLHLSCLLFSHFYWYSMRKISQIHLRNTER